MSKIKIPKDPVADFCWPPERVRRLAEASAILCEEYLTKIADLRITPVGSRTEIKQDFLTSMPDYPISDDNFISYIRALLFRGITHSGHPRYLGFIMGAGTLPGAIADFFSSVMNQNVGGWLTGPGATEIEVGLMQWLADLFKLPVTSGGLFVAGGAIANLVALKVARDQKLGFKTRRKGVLVRNLTIYASNECHATILRAVDILGIGTDSVRLVPTDAQFRMRLDLLERKIKRDIAMGARPIAVIGTAGTTSSGSLDPLAEIAGLCEEYSLWFHVDAAYGGAIALCEDLKHHLAGIEKADSISFDPHKWLYLSQSSSCILFRNLHQARRSFSIDASYAYEDRETTHSGPDLSDFGPQWSRSFQALKLWSSLVLHGKEAYSRRISHDAELARYLGSRVKEHPDFELIVPVTLSICCFRYAPSNIKLTAQGGEFLNDLNQEILTRVQFDGRVFISGTTLGKVFSLRVCIVNFRTEVDDLEAILDVVSEIGAEVLRFRLG